MKMIRMSMAVITALVVSAQATTMTTSGDWLTPGNWDAGLPNSTTDAVIAVNVTGILSGIGAAKDVIVSTSVSVLTVTNNGTLTASGRVTLGTSANTSTPATLNVHGNVTSAGLSVCNANSSRAVVNIISGTYTNTLDTRLFGGGNNGNQAELNISGTSVYNSGNNDMRFGVGGKNLTGGKLSISGGELTFGRVYVQLHSGTTYASFLFDISGGTVASTEWDLSNTLMTAGTLNITGSTANINVSGAMILSSGWTFNGALDAGGISPIKVGGTATLGNAALKVTLLNGLTYGDVGGTHKLIDAASLTGTFSSVDLSAFEGKAELVYDTANGDVLLNVEKKAKGTIILVY